MNVSVQKIPKLEKEYKLANERFYSALINKTKDNKSPEFIDIKELYERELERLRKIIIKHELPFKLKWKPSFFYFKTINMQA